MKYAPAGPITAVIICLAIDLLAQRTEPKSPQQLETDLAAANSDTARLPILDKLGRSFSRTDPERSTLYFIKLDSVAKRARSAYFEARAQNHLSFNYGLLGKNGPAIFHAKKAIHLFDSLGDRKQLGRATENLSVFYIRAGNFKDALGINLKLLDEQKKTGDPEDLFHTHQRVATIYGEQKQSRDALFHDRQSLSAAEKCGSDYLRATALGAMADDFATFPDSTKKAEEYYRSAIALFEKADTCPSCIAQFCGTLVKFYLKQKRIPAAYAFVEKGLSYSKKTNDPFAKFAMELAAAQLAIVQNRPETAHTFLKGNEELATITSDAEVEHEKLWAQYFFATGQPELGYQHLQTAFELQDSVAAETYDHGLSQIRIAYETEKKEQEAALLSVQNQSLKVKNNYFLALSILMGLLLFGGAWLISRLRSHKKLIEAQNRSLEKLNSTKDKFFAIIAHDLRGPIVSFHGLIKKINWLIARGETDRVSQLGASVDEAAAGLNKLLDNLLAWALIQRGTMPYNPENIELKEEAEAGVAAFKNALDTKNIALNMDIAEGLEVFADRAALACFVRNLTDNALKYTPNGSKIDISAKQSDTQICLSIADNGPGMDAAQVERLLSEHSPDNTAVASKGTGLGLMLCRELAELNRGKLEVISRPGDGTVISIWLPKAA